MSTTDMPETLLLDLLRQVNNDEGLGCSEEELLTDRRTAGHRSVAAATWDAAQEVLQLLRANQTADRDGTRAALDQVFAERDRAVADLAEQRRTVLAICDLMMAGAMSPSYVVARLREALAAPALPRRERGKSGPTPRPVGLIWCGRCAELVSAETLTAHRATPQHAVRPDLWTQFAAARIPAGYYLCTTCDTLIATVNMPAHLADFHPEQVSLLCGKCGDADPLKWHQSGCDKARECYASWRDIGEPADNLPAATVETPALDEERLRTSYFDVVKASRGENPWSDTNPAAKPALDEDDERCPWGCGRLATGPSTYIAHHLCTACAVNDADETAGA